MSCWGKGPIICSKPRVLGQFVARCQLPFPAYLATDTALQLNLAPPMTATSIISSLWPDDMGRMTRRGIQGPGLKSRSRDILASRTQKEPRLVSTWPSYVSDITELRSDLDK